VLVLNSQYRPLRGKMDHFAFVEGQNTKLRSRLLTRKSCNRALLYAVLSSVGGKEAEANFFFFFCIAGFVD